jgi:hypothetical protein
MAYRASYGADSYGSAFYGITGAIDGATDVTYRPGYGKATYGTAVYGNEGSETTTLTATCSAQIVVDGTSAASATSTAAASGVNVIQGQASATLQNVTLSVAEVYAETDGYRTGYGLRTYGTSIYGRNDSVETGVAAGSAALTGTCSFELVREVSAVASLALSTTANAVFSVRGEASVSTSLSLTAAFERVLQGSATSNLALSTAASGIEKWEPVDGVTDTWTPVAATSETWTPVTWSRAA